MSLTDGSVRCSSRLIVMDPSGVIPSHVKAPKGAIITCDSGESVNPIKSGEFLGLRSTWGRFARLQ